MMPAPCLLTQGDDFVMVIIPRGRVILVNCAFGVDAVASIIIVAFDRFPLSRGKRVLRCLYISLLS